MDELAQEGKEHVIDIFPDADLSLIKSIIYFDGWTSYEECGGILIFRAIDDTIQIVDYGYCVMATDNTNYFDLREVSKEEAEEEIREMKEAIDRYSL